MTTRGFFGRNRPQAEKPVPPGQYVTENFPVLTAGPTPDLPLSRWSFTIEHRGRALAQWTWEEFQALPHTRITTDLHCVTRWSKFDTLWEGVTIDDLLAAAKIDAPSKYVMAYCEGGYTTNLPFEDLAGGKGMVAFNYDDKPLEPEHGGPARLLVPHLYLWKSAKWVRGLRFMDEDMPGFWENFGYHMYGDPWREQRYSGD